MAAEYAGNKNDNLLWNLCTGTECCGDCVWSSVW